MISMALKQNLYSVSTYTNQILLDRVNKKGSLIEDKAILRQVAGALDHLHVK